MYWLFTGLAFIWLMGNAVGFVTQGAQAAFTTTLSAGISASDVTIPLNNASALSPSGLLLVDSEWLSYGAVETPCATGAFAGEPSCVTTAIRGELNSNTSSHALNATVYDEQAGSANSGLGFSRQNAITNFGPITNPIQFAGNLVSVIWQWTTWDWAMFDGAFGFMRIVGTFLITPAVLVVGLEFLRTLAGIL